MQIDHQQADQSDGDVDEKDESPMQVADDQAAGDGPEHGTDQGGNGDEAHGANQFGFGERPHQGQAADRNHHGSANALQNAESDQQVDVAGHAAEERTQREDTDRGREDATGAEAIGHPTADGNEYREA